MALVAVLIGLVASLPPLAGASPGDADPLFGAHGLISGVRATELPGGATALQGDRVLLADGPFLRRYASDGSVDPSFGAGGSQDLRAFGAKAAGDVAIDSVGRIVVSFRVSETGTSDPAIRVIRLLPDGQLDPNFGAAGTVDTGLHAGLFERGDIALYPDDGIVVSGEGATLRLTSAGLPDSSFSLDGRIERGYKQVETRPDGSTLGLTTSKLEQVRPDGEPDLGFGAGGSIDFELDTGEFALAPDGVAYVQVGSCLFHDGTCVGSLVRVLANGQRDHAFHPLDPNQQPVAAGLIADPEGRVLVTNYGIRSVNALLAVTRFMPDGSVDRTFGKKGTARVYPNGCAFDHGSLLIDSSGRVLAGGGACHRLVVVRLLNGPGRDDRDADGVVDRRDDCDVSPAEHHQGCPRVRTTISVRVGRHSIAGRVRLVSGPADDFVADYCVANRRLLLLHRRRSGTAVAARRRTNYEGRFSMKGEFSKGDYSVVAERAYGRLDVIKEKAALCAPVRAAK